MHKRCIKATYPYRPNSIVNIVYLLKQELNRYKTQKNATIFGKNAKSALNYKQIYFIKEINLTKQIYLNKLYSVPRLAGLKSIGLLYCVDCRGQFGL